MSYDPVQLLAERIGDAIARALPGVADADPLVTPCRNPELGDFQSNAAMPLAKRLGRKPRDIAAEIVGHLDATDIAEPIDESSIAGPGFINIRLRNDVLAELLSRLDSPTLGIDPPERQETVVVDLCGVNLAKQMHVGHLRSTIIGDAIARTLERLGDKVIRQNHLGDWGLPIAMVTARLDEEVRAGRIDMDRLTLDDLDRLYRLANAECDADTRGLESARKWEAHPKAVAELEEQVAGATEAARRARETLVRLQSGDPGTVGVWQRIADVTMAACLDACRRLNADIDAEDTAGESSYADELADLVADLESRGVAEESDGALVVRCEGIEEPAIVRKRDGGFLYATTDLAAIRRRVQRFGAGRVIYCVDSRQSLHFRQVFCAAHKAGYTRLPDGSPASLEHAAFGTVLGEDGRPFKTRSGENVRLSDLIDQSVQRAADAIGERGSDLPPGERENVARVVGVAALKYADLSSDRIRDYIFSFDRMLAFEGNTGPYLLYALVRIRSIFRKGAERFGDAALQAGAPFRVEQKEEKDLALTLLRYPGVVRAVGQTLEPHRLCQYLYDLAGAFSVFFTNCPVLQAPDESLRAARLRLCRLTEGVLQDGLSLLGIETLDRM